MRLFGDYADKETKIYLILPVLIEDHAHCYAALSIHLDTTNFINSD